MSDVEFLNQDDDAGGRGDAGGAGGTAPAGGEDRLVESAWTARLDRVFADRRWRYVLAGLAAFLAVATFGSVPVRGSDVAAPRPAPSTSPRLTFTPGLPLIVPEVPLSTKSVVCVFFVGRPGTTGAQTVHITQDGTCPDLHFGGPVPPPPSSTP